VSCLGCDEAGGRRISHVYGKGLFSKCEPQPIGECGQTIPVIIDEQYVRHDNASPIPAKEGRSA
jgi:hypothetical protein